MHFLKLFLFIWMFPLPSPSLHPKLSSWFFSEKQRWANKWCKRKNLPARRSCFWLQIQWMNCPPACREKPRSDISNECRRETTAPPFLKGAMDVKSFNLLGAGGLGRDPLWSPGKGFSPWFGGCSLCLEPWNGISSCVQQPSLMKWMQVLKKLPREHAHWKINPLEGVGELSYCNFSAVGCSKQLL